MTANGLYFAVRIEDAVTTFEGLPIMGFTRRKPVDQPSLYPTVRHRLLGTLLLIAHAQATVQALYTDKEP
eukprot:s3085_g3.t1